MTGQQQMAYEQLDVGYEFPPARVNLDSDLVAAYLKATGETDSLYQGTGRVPPAAIAAWSLASLLEFISLPDGTIHLSQEVQSMNPVTEGQTVICHARVSRKQERSKLKLLDIDFNVANQNGEACLAGKSGFNLP